MHLTWAICNREGKEWGWLWDRADGEVTVSLNDQRTATVKANLEERITNFIHPTKSRCKVWCHPEAEEPGGFLLHNGLILNPTTTGIEVEIPSVDQSVRLLNASPSQLPIEGEATAHIWDEVDLKDSELMWEIIDRADRRQRQLNIEEPDSPNPVPSLGIIEGVLADSFKTRSTKIAEGKTVWDFLQDIAERDHAPDFELEPLDREDGIHAAFNTFYPRMGADRRDEVILEWGRNLSPDFKYEPSGVDICNRFVAIGRSQYGFAPVYVAENRMSMGRFGIYQKEESFDTKDIDKLADIAHAKVAYSAFQVNYVEVVPAVEIGGTAKGYVRNADGSYGQLDDEFEVPPRFGPRVGLGFDYWIGDTITVRAKDQFTFNVDKDQPGPDTDMIMRVMEATFKEIDDSGNVAVSLTLAPVVAKAHTGGYPSTTRVAH